MKQIVVSAEPVDIQDVLLDVKSRRVGIRTIAIDTSDDPDEPEAPLPDEEEVVELVVDADCDR